MEYFAPQFVLVTHAGAAASHKSDVSFRDRFQNCIWTRAGGRLNSPQVSARSIKLIVRSAKRAAGVLRSLALQSLPPPLQPLGGARNTVLDLPPSMPAIAAPGNGTFCIDLEPLAWQERQRMNLR